MSVWKYIENTRVTIMVVNFSEKVNFIWSVADLLRHDYKQHEYGQVILPLTVMRRMDAVLEPTKEKVLKRHRELTMENKDPALFAITGYRFFNASRYSFQSLLADPEKMALNLKNYVNGYSKDAREIIEHFNFHDHISRLDRANLLYLVVKRFADPVIDLHPDAVSNIEMGYIFEELIRRFAEQSNETAGEHFTPREVIKLMVHVLFAEDAEALTKSGIIRTLYDPGCGTGGMLSVAEDYLREINPGAQLKVFGQEINPESYAICKADMLIKGQNAGNIKFGNSFTHDGFEGTQFDYMLCNPPFGVEWKKFESAVRDEHNKKGFGGRFGAGLPRINDGSLLFLQHMISKMNPANGGSRIAIVFNGSPLFTGDAGSGESNIRKWIIENDMLEAIIALPNDMFYNTGIATYVWVVTNRKEKRRRGRVQLINAVGFYEKMRKSLGSKRNYITDERIAQITALYRDFADNEYSRIFDNGDFGYRRITVERPLRLNFAASMERIERLKEASAFRNLAVSKKKGKAGEKEIEEGRRVQEAFLAALAGMGDTLYVYRDAFTRALDEAINTAGVKLPAPVRKAALTALSERDEHAEICVTAKGDPEPDAELRDFENIPLKDNIEAYFEREVRPYVPDAWIDESKTKIGYEIPFTRHFYVYQKLRPLEVIDKEIWDLEREIQDLLKEVTHG